MAAMWNRLPGAFYGPASLSTPISIADHPITDLASKLITFVSKLPCPQPLRLLALRAILAVGLDRNLWGLTIGKLLSKLRNEPPGAGSKNQIRQPESPAYILWEQGKSE
ncbi:hypothetical protein H4Q26_002881 [Puccinia striiformis f. sp. tritici PST-130]|nr:hypothetical protein H4Q26_002881 [Puccinia striiformis f. sp. tritici PST-130]